MFLINQRHVFRLTLVLCILLIGEPTYAQRRVPSFGIRAVVVDERLSALREQPDLRGRLLQRMSRGRNIAILGSKKSADGVTFFRVAVTRRTRGWVQTDAVISPTRSGDDERLLRLIRASEGYDRIVRARIFLENFNKSSLRPVVLLLYGEAAEEVAERLSRDASRRIDDNVLSASNAAFHSYFLNYSGLDRFNRQGIRFVFDRQSKRFHYDGASWRELVRRYPASPEAQEARKRLENLDNVSRR